MATDADYRAQQQDCMQKWQKERPPYRHQKQYREKYSKYIEANRQKQTIRNRRKHTQPQTSAMIKKME
jgi:hypothetical protein